MKLITGMVNLFTTIIFVLAGFGMYKLVMRVLNKDLKDIKIEDIFIAVITVIIYSVGMIMILENMK